jgi:hypothetical protein
MKGIDYTLPEATAFVRDCGMSLSADFADQIIRTFKKVWLSLFGYLTTATEYEVASAPSLDEQLYDCAVLVSDQIGVNDPLEMLKVIDSYVAWESPKAKKPFSVRSDCRRTTIEYGPSGR